MIPASSPENSFPALRRLSSRAQLGPKAVALLTNAADNARTAAAGRELSRTHFGADARILILEGWAIKSFLLVDGRRQITDFLLPGDIGDIDRQDEADASSLRAITSVTYCMLPADDVAACPELTDAFASIHRMEDKRLRRHVVRLGRMSALERIADWLCELYDRLDAAGLCSGDTMPLPVTQEIMADALGLTSVHVNRMLGALRSQGFVQVQYGRVTFLDRSRCRAVL